MSIDGGYVMKVALITGSTTGLGKALCQELARNTRDKHGEEYLIFASYRNLQAAKIFLQEMRRDFPAQKIEIFSLDLASFASLRAALRELKKKLGKNKISLLINNAGARVDDDLLSEDGYPLMRQVNFISTSLFTLALSSYFAPQAVVVNVISMLYRMGSSKENFFSRMQKKNSFASGMRAYGESKLANFLFVQALAKKENNITFYGVDPWIISTNMIRMNAWYDPLADIFFRPFILTPAQAAVNVLETLKMYPPPHGKLVDAKKKKVLLLRKSIEGYGHGDDMLRELQSMGRAHKIF